MKFHFFSIWMFALASTLLMAGWGGSNNGPSPPRPTATATATPGGPNPTTTPTATSTPVPTPVPVPVPVPVAVPMPGGANLRGQIAFVSTRTGTPDIYLMNAQGTDQRAFAALNTPAQEREPSLSRGGAFVVWSSNRATGNSQSNFEIYLARADGSDVRQYTSDSGSFPPSDTQPVFSPDGSKIVWTTTRGGNRNIAVMDATGNNQNTLTSNFQEDSHPAWSSDGRTIAFYSVRGNARGIYQMNADGSNQRALLVSEATEGTRYFDPAYSPDGTQLAVVLETAGGTTISLRNLDGTQSATTFRASGSLSQRTNPSFSPDGTRLIYTGSNGGAGQQIYTANLDGSNERALTMAGTNFEARFGGSS